MQDAVALVTESFRTGPPVMAAIPLSVTGRRRRKRSTARLSCRTPPGTTARSYRPDPGHGPGVSTSGSSSVFVSKSRKPRRR